MRIALVTHSYLVDMTRKKLEILSDKGMRVTLITPARWPHALKTYTVEGNASGKLRLIALKTLFEGNNVLYYLRGLKETLRSLKPDIVHVEEEPYSVAACESVRAVAAKSGNAKTLFFTWENIFKEHPFPLSLAEKYVLEHADCAIAGSTEAKKVLGRKGFRRRVETMPQMGIDTALFRKKGRKPDVFTIGFVGRLVPEKGVFDLLQACSLLDRDFKIVIVGGGPAKDDIVSLAGELGLEERVEMVGTVPDHEVAGYMNRMHCLVVPSRTTERWKEQFGHTLVEGMSCEVPVVGSDSGAIPDVVGGSGLIFGEGDTAGLKTAITRLMDSPRLQKRLGRDGRKRVLKEYSWKKIADKTFRVYEALA